MIYSNLAKYYDALLKDEEAFLMWYQFYLNNRKKGSTLELGSGTGEITLKIAKNDNIDASDISDEMLNELKRKDKNSTINNYFKYDLLDLNILDTYDNIICFCDSINYILDYDTLNKAFINIYKSLSDKGVFMFDMHTVDRLSEFSEGYLEVGSVLDTDYQWQITSEDNYIINQFMFYEDTTIVENHIQRVFDLDKVVEMLQSLNFEVEYYTDFNKEGLHPGEKYFIVGRKL